MNWNAPVSTYTYFGFAVEMRKDGLEQVSDQRRLVVGGRIERHESDSPHVEVVVTQRLEEIAHVLTQQRVNRLRLTGHIKQN